MDPTDENAPRSFRVMCPTCHERYDVRLMEKPQKVACTYCETPISVPSREQAQQQLQAQRPAPGLVLEEYKLAVPERGSKANRQPTPGAEQPANEKPSNGKINDKADALLVLVTCPTCHERMRAPAEESPRKIACTYCGTAVPVPGREAVARWKAKRVQTHDQKAIGEYAAAAPHEVAPPRMHLFDRLAEIRTEAPIPPPRWAFFSRVFSFPWHAEVLFRWSAITLGFTILSLLGSFLLGGGVGLGPKGMGVMGMGFFGLPILWISIFTFSYSADCCLCVIESTSYGHDRIEAWTEGGWKEWMPQLIYMGWIAMLPAMVSAGVGRLAELGGAPFWPVMLVTLFVLYPIALLSALEANSAWVPLTWPIVRTLILVWRAWMMFYILTGILAGGLVALLLVGVPMFGLIAMIPFGPLLAAFLLIYARLLGRLAWKIGQVLTA